MKKLVKTIILVLLSGLFTTALAQVSATMEVRVEIVSAASLKSQGAHLQFPGNDLPAKKIKAGTLSLRGTGSTDTDIRILEIPYLINNEGDVIEFEELMLLKKDKGCHKEVSFEGQLKKKSNLKGHYKGQLRASVVYL